MDFRDKLTLCKVKELLHCIKDAIYFKDIKFIDEFNSLCRKVALMDSAPKTNHILREENMELKFKLGLLERKMGALYEYNPKTGLCTKETEFEKLTKENEQLKERLRMD